MTEERFESAEAPCQAIQILKILINFGLPKSSSEVQGWSKKVQYLQMLLSNIWQNDSSGKIMIKCLNHLYNEIAHNETPVSPAVWMVLGLVDEKKISEFVEGIFLDQKTNDSTKVQNVLIAIIEGLCQCGPSVKSLKDWIFAIVKGLESQKNYTILIEVSENVINKLMKSLFLPIFRPVTYPVFRQFLYPVVTPHVFYKIIDSLPDVIYLLQKDVENEKMKIIFSDFIGLIRTLLIQFPPKPGYENKYENLKVILAKLPESNFDAESMVLWDPKLNDKSDWNMETVNSNFSEMRPQLPYKGLINQGNTCFMNSILQILYMTTRFRKELLERELDASERAASDLQELFAFMQESKRSVLVPNGVMDSTLPPTFRRGHQQDSSEYLIYLLDILHEDENKINRKKRQTGLVLKNSEKKKEGNGDFEGATSSKSAEESTFVERLFGGISMSTTICSSCKKSFPKNDNFRDLHLSLPDDYKSFDLQELIDVSLQSEELCSENMYDCATCGTKRNATRKHTIVKAPQHLILTLKLFRFDPLRKQRLKLHSKLKNAKSIELPVYNSSQLQKQLVMYDLKGVVLHSGSSLDGGHYFSSAVDQSGQWYIFNDSVVSEAKYEWNSSGGTPYILFLRQSDICDPPPGSLPHNLQLLVNRDNQKFLADKRYQQRSFQRNKDYDDEDDWDDSPPNGDSFGGPGPSLVF